MFDVNNGPPNFPILAHSINIYYLQPIYENMGSESGVSLREPVKNVLAEFVR